MIRLETEIHIAASPERVWQELTNFASFPEWNSLLTEVQGKPELNAKLKVKASAPDGSGATYNFQVMIIDCQPCSYLAWKGGVPGILTGIHFWRLSPTDTGTHLVHGEDFSGLYVWLMGRKRILSFKPAYEAMNEALAARALRVI